MRTRWSWLAVFLVGLVVASLVVSEHLTSSEREGLFIERVVEPDSPADVLPAPSPVATVIDPQVVRPITREPAWADIPLDTEGASLGDQMTSFNRAFADVAVSDVKTCLAGTARDTSLLVKVALSIEGTATGYDVLDAQVLDGQLDADRKRCLELAMAGQIDVPGVVGEPGKRYRLEFPILVTASR